MDSDRRLRGLRAPGCLALLSVLVFQSNLSNADEALPRYKLKVGQELVYRTTDPPREADDGAGGKASHRTTYQWTANVISQEPDGHWWIVFREKITSTYSRAGKDSTQELETDGHFLLSAAGKLVENPTIKPMSNPTALFPPLPNSVAELKDGWESQLQLDDTRRTFQFSPSAQDTADRLWHFSERPHTALDAIYESTAERDYTFDPEAGLVRKLRTTYRQGWPAQAAQQETVQTCELVENRQLDADDLAKLATQARSYFSAVAEADRLAQQAAHDFSHSAANLLEAEKLLKQAADAVTAPTLRSLAESRLQQLRRDAKFTLQDAVQFGLLTNRPSPNWRTTDLDGHERGLAEYRGKVLVLDFWYRGCGWCIRAMPQMKQLADDFAGQDVAIVGVNSDQNLDDARFVIDRLKLNYPTIKNGESGDAISPKYKIHGWPTLVIIDQQGVVRHFHFGYSPTLRSELADKIRELLAKPAG